MIGSVRDCWIEHLPDAHEAAGRHAIGLSRQSRFRPPARGARAPPPLREPDRRRAPAPHPRRGTGRCPALTFAPVAASRWAITPLTGARTTNSPSASVGASSCGRRWYCARLASAAVSAGLRLLLGGSRLVQPLCRARRRRSSAARRVRDRESPARAPSALPRAPAAAAAGRPAPRAAAAAGRAPGRERQLAPSATSTTRVRRPSMGATTSAAPPGLASRRAGTRIDSRTACSFTRAVPKSRLHCCSFRKLMPGASSSPPPARRRGPLPHSGDTSTSPTRCSSFNPVELEHDDELALARVRRLHVDAEDPRARRRVDAKHFRLAEPPSSRTSTLPSVSALKVSSRVR